MIKSANLVFSLSRSAGGLYESVRRLVQSLDGEGVGVIVFGPSDQYTVEDLGRWDPIKVRSFKPVWPESFGFSSSYMEALNEYAPDLVHTHGIWVYPSMAARRYCMKTGARSIISAHGMLDPWALNNSKWKKVIAYALYEGAHLKNASCLRALCKSEASSIRKIGLKNPIAVIPNGMDIPKEEPSVPAIWKTLVEPGRKVLLYLGRLHPKKNLLELIRAWKKTLKLRPAASEWILAICGWDQGGYEEELKKLATELEVAWLDIRGNSPVINRQLRSTASILFTGPQFNEAKAAAYFQSAAFILPSLSEGLPMVVLEAWAWGLPVLVTPECNLPEGLQTGAAIQIDTNAAGIAEGLCRLIDMTDEERAVMGRKGSSLIKSEFSWDSIALKMKSLYVWMLGGGESPPFLLEK